MQPFWKTIWQNLLKVNICTPSKSTPGYLPKRKDGFIHPKPSTRISMSPKSQKTRNLPNIPQDGNISGGISLSGLLTTMNKKELITHKNMGGSHRHFVHSQSSRHKRQHPTRFHLKKPQEQAKEAYGDRGQKTEGEGHRNWEGAAGSLGTLSFSGSTSTGYTQVKLHQIVHLIVVLFTECNFHPNQKKTI